MVYKNANEVIPQPTILFCKKSLISIFTKEINGLFGIVITDLNRIEDNVCVHVSWIVAI